MEIVIIKKNPGIRKYLILKKVFFLYNFIKKSKEGNSSSSTITVIELPLATRHADKKKPKRICRNLHSGFIKKFK